MLIANIMCADRQIDEGEGVSSFITLIETRKTKVRGDFEQCTDKTLILYIYMYRFKKYSDLSTLK